MSTTSQSTYLSMVHGCWRTERFKTTGDSMHLQTCVTFVFKDKHWEWCLKPYRSELFLFTYLNEIKTSSFYIQFEKYTGKYIEWLLSQELTFLKWVCDWLPQKCFVFLGGKGSKRQFASLWGFHPQVYYTWMNLLFVYNISTYWEQTQACQPACQWLAWIRMKMCKASLMASRTWSIQTNLSTT